MKGITIVIVCLFASLVALHAADPPKPQAMPSIVTLLVDDMGYGDPQCYNPQSKIATPNIDRLAREGPLFTTTRANGTVCSPSRAALLTGRYADRVGDLAATNMKLLN